MTDQLGLVIEATPGDSARIIGIVLEREEPEIIQAAVLFQIIQEATQPGNLAVTIGPDFYVFVDSLEGRSAKLQGGIDAMKRCGPLEVECGVVFRHHELAIRFFAHFDVRDGIVAFLEIGNFGRGVVGSVIKQGDGHHRR